MYCYKHPNCPLVPNASPGYWCDGGCETQGTDYSCSKKGCKIDVCKSCFENMKEGAREAREKAGRTTSRTSLEVQERQPSTVPAPGGEIAVRCATHTMAMAPNFGKGQYGCGECGKKGAYSCSSPGCKYELCVLCFAKRKQEPQQEGQPSAPAAVAHAPAPVVPPTRLTIKVPPPKRPAPAQEVAAAGASPNAGAQPEVVAAGASSQPKAYSLRIHQAREDPLSDASKGSTPGSSAAPSNVSEPPGPTGSAVPASSGSVQAPVSEAAGTESAHSGRRLVLRLVPRPQNRELPPS